MRLLLTLVSLGLSRAQQCSWSSPDGNYQIEWEYDPRTQLVTFGIDARHPYLAAGGQDTWTGLMIGESMGTGDFLIVDVLQNNGIWDVGFRDMRSSGGRSSPIPDDAGQDHIVSGEGRVVDGRIYARFSRPLTVPIPKTIFAKYKTQDSGDQNLADCGIQFNFPVTGGQLFRNGDRLFIGKHTTTPVALGGICITRDCVKEAPTPRTNPPTRPPPVTQPPRPPPTRPPRTFATARPTPRPTGANNAQRQLGSGTGTDDAMPVLNCSPGQTDHSSCFGYLEEYFQNVTNWAEQNAFEPSSQFPRACRLLAETQNGLIKAVCCRNLSERFCRPGRRADRPFN